MATLAQIGDALKKADAAGNAEDARKLAQAYRAMQAQQVAASAAPIAVPPPAGLAPGSKEYADWAVQQAKAGKVLPQVSQTAPTPDTSLPEQIMAGTSAAARSIPIAGPAAIKGLEGMRASVQGMTPEQVAAETKAREAANPTAMTVGEVTGTVAPFVMASTVPVLSTILGLDAAASVPLQIGAGALSQAAISRADAAVRGETPEEANQAGLIGLGAGAAAPIVGKYLTQAGEAVIKPLGKFVFGADNTAQRVIASAARADKAAGAELGQTDTLAAAANGQPLINADRFGTNVRTLARTASNLDPTAAQTLGNTVADRFKTQGARAISWLQSRGIPTDVHALQQTIDATGRSANKRNYFKAYAHPASPGVLTVPVDPANPVAGDVLAPEIHSLMQAEPFQQAIKRAVGTAKTDAALHGFPPVENPFRFNKDGTYDWVEGAKLPALPFWDQVQRNLANSAKVAARQGDNLAASHAWQLRGKLNQALDTAIPDFGAARSGAAAKFGAEDALEAGQNFVKAPLSELPAMSAAHAQFSPAEKKLFASGFASSLIDKIGKVGDTTDVINSVFASPKARQQVALALGPQAAAELEQFLRIENAMRMTKAALEGGSNTVKQLAALGVVGGAAGGLSSGDVNPLHWMNPSTMTRIGGGSAAMMMFGRAGAKLLGKAVDNNVMQTVAKALASNDPAEIQKAVKMAAKSSKSAMAVKAIEQGLSMALRAGGGAATPAAAQQLETVQ